MAAAQVVPARVLMSLARLENSSHFHRQHSTALPCLGSRSWMPYRLAYSSRPRM
jgi:hypothetical protein